MNEKMSMATAKRLARTLLDIEELKKNRDTDCETQTMQTRKARELRPGTAGCFNQPSASFVKKRRVARLINGGIVKVTHLMKATGYSFYTVKKAMAYYSATKDNLVDFAVVDK